MPKKMSAVVVDGVEYVPKSLVGEALDIIGGLSQLYDNLAANPSGPTPEEEKRERKLVKRWTKLSNLVNPPQASDMEDLA
jgi:hypothetical protein